MQLYNIHAKHVLSLFLGDGGHGGLKCLVAPRTLNDLRRVGELDEGCQQAYGVFVDVVEVRVVHEGEWRVGPAALALGCGGKFDHDWNVNLMSCNRARAKNVLGT